MATHLNTKKNLAVDWDGTCVPKAYPLQPREWLPGALEALTELQKKFNVWIFSVRIAAYSEYPEWDTALPKEQWQGEIDYIESMLKNAKLTRVKVWKRNFKVPAELYIDDRGLHYDGDWSSVMEQVTKRTGVKFVHAKRVKSATTSMYLESTSGMSPRQIRNKVNGFIKD